jgi:LmbE family N-acetylglucosaminyl deacetylase
MNSTIFAIFAHPDDESFGPAGTLALLSKKYRIILIYATLGENYNKNEKLYQQNKMIRKKEVITASNHLGITHHIFLHYPDGELNTKKYHTLYLDLEKLIDRYNAQTIITFEPLGLTGHIDHIVLTSVIKKLYQLKKGLKTIFFYCLLTRQVESVHQYFTYFPSGYKQSDVDHIVDITGTWEHKQRAMASHISQKKDHVFWSNIYKIKQEKEHFLVDSKADIKKEMKKIFY